MKNKAKQVTRELMTEIERKIENGEMTINQARQLCGLPPTENGDMLLEKVPDVYWVKRRRKKEAWDPDKTISIALLVILGLAAIMLGLFVLRIFVAFHPTLT